MEITLVDCRLNENSVNDGTMKDTQAEVGIANNLRACSNYSLRQR
jgi:hypothetical protein